MLHAKIREFVVLLQRKGAEYAVFRRVIVRFNEGSEENNARANIKIRAFVVKVKPFRNMRLAALMLRCRVRYQVKPGMSARQSAYSWLYPTQ